LQKWPDLNFELDGIIGVRGKGQEIEIEVEIGKRAEQLGGLLLRQVVKRDIAGGGCALRQGDIMV
jgi:hypothetical protein